MGDALRRNALQRHAAATVHFRGWVAPSEVQRLALRSRARLLPSVWYERADSLGVIQVLTCGPPVLTSELGATVALLKQVGGQWLLAPRHPGSWTSGSRVTWNDDQVDRSSKRLRKISDQHQDERLALRPLEDASATARHAAP